MSLIDQFDEQHAKLVALRAAEAELTEGADAEYEDQVLPLVEDNLNGARRVLDVGCGEGQVARRMARLGAAVVGIDPSQLEDSILSGISEKRTTSSLHQYTGPVKSACDDVRDGGANRRQDFLRE